jgi:fucose permease
MATFWASAWVALYWVALTAGRLWLGVVGHRRSDGRVLGGACVGAIAGSALLWGGGPVAPAGLVVAGLALSVVFPLLMLRTPQRVGAERAAAAVGWQAAAAAVGSAGGPAAAGLVLEHAGIGAYGPTCLAVAALLALVLVALELTPRRVP